MINRVILVGRLTRAPELRTTPNGVNVCTFTLAFDNKTRSADGSKTSSFINCTAWRQRADFLAKYCDKGTQIGVEGSLQERKYQRKDGSNASVIEVVVDEISLFGSKGTNNSSPAIEQEAGYERDAANSYDDMMAQGDGDLADDDLPF